ncbi:hypothetical protein Pcinc_025074 [Petrolisthes cinctipes]|uniref:Uncharacterized protein n=1 Tax=Petrolisthes cinctipes TaxID=88211 RepID=A0AAE1FBC7_PETCI|nr:hypothetical protein Pcinc_025074 [Petrolisthes cinctipes]
MDPELLLWKIDEEDLKLYFSYPISPSSATRAIDRLQDNITFLYETASSWSLKFAAEKRVHLRFSHSQNQPVTYPIYHLGGVPVQPADSQRDL